MFFGGDKTPFQLLWIVQDKIWKYRSIFFQTQNLTISESLTENKSGGSWPTSAFLLQLEGLKTFQNRWLSSGRTKIQSYAPSATSRTSQPSWPFRTIPVSSTKNGSDNNTTKCKPSLIIGFIRRLLVRWWSNQLRSKKVSNLEFRVVSHVR